VKNQAQIEALKTKAENSTTQRDAILAKGALSDEDQKSVQGYNDELAGIRDTVKAINDTGEIDKELSSMFGAAKAPPAVEIDPNSEDGKAHIDGKASWSWTTPGGPKSRLRRLQPRNTLRHSRSTCEARATLLAWAFRKPRRSSRARIRKAGS
jgi:hypothetical protein